MHQATTEINPRQHISPSDMDGRDIAIVPQDPLSQEYSLEGSGRTRPGESLHDMADERHYVTAPAISNMQSTPLASDSLHHTTPIKHPTSLFQRVGDFISNNLSPESSSAKFQLDQQLREQLHRKEREIEHLREILGTKDDAVKQISRDNSNRAGRQKEKFQQILDNREREWKASMEEIESSWQQIHHDQNERIRNLEAKVRETTSDRELIREKYNEVIRKQQEDSFKQMESGRWLPSEESKVVRDLDRIKREMKSLAKGVSIKDMALLQTLDRTDSASLKKDLSHVVLLENNQFPPGLSTPKSPSLLLNALLAYDMYTTLFRNPFFFLEDRLRHTLPRAGLENALDMIYQRAQTCKLTNNEERAFANYLSRSARGTYLAL
jgi:hypothetical protein